MPRIVSLLSCALATCAPAVAHAQPAEKLYLLHGSIIKILNPDGSAFANLIAHPSVSGTGGLAVDWVNQTLYWSDGVRSIYRSGLDGSGLELFYTVPGQFGGIPELEIDPAAGLLFWVDREAGVHADIYAGGLDGSAPELVMPGNVEGFALDRVNQMIYYVDEDNVLARVRYDGTGREDLLAGNGTGAIEYDAGAGLVFWAEGHELYKFDPASGVNDLMYDTQSFFIVSAIALDRAAGDVYFSFRNDDLDPASVVLKMAYDSPQHVADLILGDELGPFPPLQLEVGPAPDLLPPYVIDQPRSILVSATDSFTLGVEADGALPLAYQWRRDGQDLSDSSPNVSGAITPTLTVTDATSLDEGVYTCLVTNPVSFAVTQDAIVAVRQCLADTDGSGTLDFSDVLGFLAAFGGGCPN